MFFRVILFLFLFAATAYSRPAYPPPTRTGAPDVTIAVSADGQTVAIARSSGGGAKRYGRIELWNTRNGELQRTITGFDGPIWSMAFSKDGKSVITISTEYRDSKIQSSVKKASETVRAELKWWDTQSGEFVKRLPLGDQDLWFVEAGWSPAGDLLALVEHYGRGHYEPIPGFGPLIQRWVSIQELNLRLLDAKSGEPRAKVERGEQIYSSKVTYLGRMVRPVFSADGNASVVLWNVPTGKVERILR